MEIYYSIFLIIAAFLLGACPFSVWIGRLFLKKDIIKYGDGNPGAANVFRAGNIKLGLLAVLLDILKGIPFVYITYAVFDLSAWVIVAVGLAAILGHSFSPLLKFKGGKSIAVTFGVIIAIPQVEILAVFTLLTLFGFLFIEQHSWAVMPGPIGTLIYLLIAQGNSWETLFMVCILALFIIKQYDGLWSIPRFKPRLINWLQSRSRET
ncbi:MAG: glycerol-3-phosphate acyltransferase [Dehalococcoidia bacterium]|nr:MAG: glycerol-3-phosphate acyltransferase [Dehalococcoidia bacterium]